MASRVARVGHDRFSIVVGKRIIEKRLDDPIDTGGLLPAERIKDLMAEANEITAIMVASRKTA